MITENRRASWKRYRDKNLVRLRARDRNKWSEKIHTSKPEEVESIRAAKAKYDKEYRERKREHRRAYMKAPENVARWNQIRKANYRENHPIPVRLTEAQKAEHIRVWHRKRRLIPKHRIKANYYNRVAELLRGHSKSKRTQELIGCTREQLMTHLESQFQKGMTWGNYGRDGWHMDHRIPCASFDLSKPEDQQKCFHYTNLQPLWAVDNIRKGDKVPDPKLVQQLLV